MNIVTSENFKSEVLEFDGVVLVDFYADWCGPCRMILPFLEDIKSEMDIKIVKVNIDSSHDIAAEYDVMSIPTLILFEGGKRVSTNVGAASKARIVEWVLSHVDCKLKSE